MGGDAMCTVSFVMEARRDDWQRRIEIFPSSVPPVLPHEVEEFRRLLDRARQYDRDHGEPNCELEEKRRALKKLAKAMGLEIDFV
jgi:hypothetical protein